MLVPLIVVVDIEKLRQEINELRQDLHDHIIQQLDKELSDLAVEDKPKSVKC